MRYLLLGLLISCGYNPQNISYGDKVKVINGFYQGSTGKVIDEHIWIFKCQHHFFIEEIKEFISVCDLEKKEK